MLTGSSSSSGAASSALWPSTPQPSAQSPSAATSRGSGIAAYAAWSAAAMRVVTGPVTSSTSACRGDATTFRPYCCMS